MEQNVSLKFKGCDVGDYSAFIGALESSGDYVRTAYYPVSEKSHQERFRYLLGNTKISVVFDTKGKILELSSRADIAQSLAKLFKEFSPLSEPLEQSLPSPKQSPQKTKANVQNPQSTNQAAQKQSKQKLNPQNKLQDVQKNQKGEQSNLQQQQNPKSQKQQNQAQQKKQAQQKPQQNQVQQNSQQKTNLPLNNALPTKNNQQAQQNQAQQKKQQQPQSKQKPQQNQQKSKAAKNQKNDKNDYKSAVNTYIKQSGEEESAAAIERKLKKLIPVAFDFLSEQSKKDLLFAFIDINNAQLKMSDYSALLVTPYRALERYIYDLQAAEGIKVKMIGQAYEKDDSSAYRLKSGYRKKIRSAVYNHVLSVLYKEYFDKRNFYLHSDNTQNWSTRMIQDKAEAKKIFDNLLEIINEYSCMLQEIGFSTDGGVKKTN